MFKIGSKVASVLNASKTGVVVDTGLSSEQGVQWVEVKFTNGRRRWMLADALREYSSSRSIHVPDGTVVLVRKGHLPEVFMQSTSTASYQEVEIFATEIVAMYASRLTQGHDGVPTTLIRSAE